MNKLKPNNYIFTKMKPVIQEEPTGCAIASAAAIAGISYTKAKQVANKMGIFAQDASLWSDPKHIRDLLEKLSIKTDTKEVPFTDWKSLPDCALLSTKWHMEAGKPFWHWAVFVRDNDGHYVLDSKKSLKKNLRRDFGKIKPKWYIKVYL